MSNSQALVEGFDSFYTTDFGAAYVADALDILKALPKDSIHLVLTSPPYALHFQKEYGNVGKSDYIEWFLEFAQEIYNIIPEDGSFVLNIGGSYNKGKPTRSLYHFKLLIALVEEVGFHLAQECFWFNPAKLPMPAEWVTVRRIRIRDAVEYIWWLSKTPWPKATNLSVLRPYSKDMERLHKRGVKRTTRPSGHTIKTSFSEISAGGSIPPNVIEDEISLNMLKFGNNASNDPYIKSCKKAGLKPHPARFPAALPEFFIKMLTEEGDVVLDPFAGSNTTGAAAEKLRRYWIAVDNVESYLEGSKYRFDSIGSADSDSPQRSYQMQLRL
jgi:DNA modification methylase